MKYTAIINFKIEIEAEHLKQAEYIASKALPTNFNFMDGNGGSGTFLRGLAPVVYANEGGLEEVEKQESYFRNR